MTVFNALIFLVLLVLGSADRTQPLAVNLTQVNSDAALIKLLKNTPENVVIIHADSAQCVFASSTAVQFEEAAALLKTIGKHIDGSTVGDITMGYVDINTCPRALQSLSTPYVPALVVLPRAGKRVAVLDRDRDSWSIVNAVLRHLGLIKVNDEEALLTFAGPSVPLVLARLPESNLQASLKIYHQILQACREGPRSSFCRLTPFFYAVSETQSMPTVETHDGMGRVGTLRNPFGDVEATVTFLQRECAPTVARLTHTNFEVYLDHDVLLFIGTRGQYDSVAPFFKKLANAVRRDLLAAVLTTEEFNTQAWGTLGVADVPSILIQTKGPASKLYTVQAPLVANLTVEQLTEIVQSILRNPTTAAEKQRSLSSLFPAPKVTTAVANTLEPTISGRVSTLAGNTVIQKLLQHKDSKRIVAVLRPGGLENFRLEEYMETILPTENTLLMKIDGLQNDLTEMESYGLHIPLNRMPTVICFPQDSMAGISHPGMPTERSLNLFLRDYCV